MYFCIAVCNVQARGEIMKYNENICFCKSSKSSRLMCYWNEQSTLTGVSIYMQKSMFFLEGKVLVKNGGLSMFHFLLAILEIYREKGSNQRNPPPGYITDVIVIAVQALHITSYFSFGRRLLTGSMLFLWYNFQISFSNINIFC